MYVIKYETIDGMVHVASAGSAFASMVDAERYVALLWSMPDVVRAWIEYV